MKKIAFKGRGITGGIAEGEAMVSQQAFGFSHGLEPDTGRISDESHEWQGKNVRGKVLVFPFGKGSTSGGLYILEAVKLGNAPAAVINLEVDPVTAGGFIIAKILYGIEIPVIDRVTPDPIKAIKTGDRVRVDASQGTIEFNY